MKSHGPRSLWTARSEAEPRAAQAGFEDAFGTRELRRCPLVLGLVGHRLAGGTA